MARRYYSDLAAPTSLSASAGASDVTLNVVSTAGFPSVPFAIGVDRGTASAEAMLVTATTSSTMTVVRGFDSTAGQSHSSGAAVEHTSLALDFDDANSHIWDTTRDDHSQYMNFARASAYFPKTYMAIGPGAQMYLSGSWQVVSSQTIPTATFPRKLIVWSSTVLFSSGNTSTAETDITINGVQNAQAFAQQTSALGITLDVRPTLTSLAANTSYTVATRVITNLLNFYAQNGSNTMTCLVTPDY